MKREDLGRAGTLIGAIEAELCGCGCGQVERYLAFINDHKCDKKVTADRAIAFFCRYKLVIERDSVDSYLTIECGCGLTFPICAGEHS